MRDEPKRPDPRLSRRLPDPLRDVKPGFYRDLKELEQQAQNAERAS